ncbi:MAG: hypothetical protein AB7P33_10210 [Dehalococcoidia bacterium]
MAMHGAGVRLHIPDDRTTTRSDVLAALPSGTLVATFRSRSDAGAAAIQLRTNDPDLCLWLRSGHEASAAIRGARAGRSFLMRILRGFGNEELMVREVLRRADEGESVLVVRDNTARTLKALNQAAHIYRFGVWTTRPLL